MAPPPEYDKEPKAPDKNAVNVPCEDPKEDLLKDQQTCSDIKSTNVAAVTEVENKNVESLNDGQLRALLNEAINYKSPKDREGKSVLFQELLQEAVEKDEAACEAGARVGRGARRAGGGALSASMQDLVAAALAAEPTPHARRSRHHHTNVSARAIHGGSLPSGVDTTFLASEEPIRVGKEYVATVQCVNPSPHFERRVSISDAHSPQEVEQLNRSKPVFPMTYTSCATLEIGSRSVCSGRAVTTTTASNQVRTPPPTQPRYNQRFYQNRPRLTHPQAHLERRLSHEGSLRISPTCGPPERLFSKKTIYIPTERPDSNQMKLMNALNPKSVHMEANKGGGMNETVYNQKVLCKDANVPRGPLENVENTQKNPKKNSKNKKGILPISLEQKNINYSDVDGSGWVNNVDSWYKGLTAYTKPWEPANHDNVSVPNLYQYKESNKTNTEKHQNVSSNHRFRTKSTSSSETNPNINLVDIASGSSTNCFLERANLGPNTNKQPASLNKNRITKEGKHSKSKKYTLNKNVSNLQNEENMANIVRNNKSDNKSDTRLRKNLSSRLASLDSHSLSSVNPKNIRSMSVAKPVVRLNSSTIERNIPIKAEKKCDSIIVSNSKATINKNRNKSKPKTHVLSNTIHTLNENDVRLLQRLSEPDADSQIVSTSDKKRNNKQCNSSRRENKLPVNYLPSSTLSHCAVSKTFINEKTLQGNSNIKCNKIKSENDSDNNLTISTKFISADTGKNVELTNRQELSVRSHTNRDCFIEIPEELLEYNNNFTVKEIKSKCDISSMKEATDIELEDLASNKNDRMDSFCQYYEDQQKLFRSLKETAIVEFIDKDCTQQNLKEERDDCKLNKSNVFFKVAECNEPIVLEAEESENIQTVFNTNNNISLSDSFEEMKSNDSNDLEVAINTKDTDDGIKPTDQYILAELPNNAYIFLTLPNRLRTNSSLQDDVKNNNSVKPLKNVTSDKNKVPKKKEKQTMVSFSGDGKKIDKITKNTLKILLFENLFKSDDKSKLISRKPELPSVSSEEVDSAISFSCITTPEVVASCNTTSSTSQSAVAVDAKPRSVITSSINGLPLSRATYGSTTSTAPEDNKKSLDENGNSVQGFSSPLSGSSQHKKPRRKKSSKNETVINSHQIDGYQGNKDLNELLRFIEADNGRGQKLARSKHKDDSEDKSGKKRSTERRKDKENKMKRANSMEELSRTKLEDLTDKPELSLRNNKKERWTEGSGPKAERRSWGDDARETFFYREREPAESAPEAGGEGTLELTDFQTVTKKRKPRKRAEEIEREAAGGDPPRRPRAPSPRSNDSNDDMDSVHSLPADTAQTRPNVQPSTHASYADIARTRHNIPDLIESCNFYTEAEPGTETRTVPQNEEPSLPAPGDVDGYPALEARTVVRGRGKDSKPRRKERETAPDVVSDRRPAVILLDSSNVGGDMDGVTFGFDINEQLVGGARRCDLVRDAPDAVPVSAGRAALTYLPPKRAPHSPHLHQIIDYVGNAWEDIVRCGTGKVRYYSE